MIAERVTRDQRFSRNFPCPICDGGHDDNRGNGTRCWGFTSEDDGWAICTNKAHAGGLTQNPRTQGYHHHLEGACPCGIEHGAAPAARPSRGERAPTRSHLRETPDAIHRYGDHLRLLRYGSGKSKRLCWQHKLDGRDWIDGQGKFAPDTYRVEDLAGVNPWAPIFIPEGEKCVDVIVAVGGIAVCNPGGAGHWRDIDSNALAGLQAVILADPDEKGRAHAKQEAAGLAAYASTVRILELAHDGRPCDAAEWLAAGHTLAELRRLAADAPIISAVLLSAPNSNPAAQDATTAQGQKTCSECAPLREQLRITNTSLDNLRRERALEGRYMAMPNAKLSAPAKLAMIAISREMRAPTRSRGRDEEGRERFYRAAVGATLGCSESVAGAHIRKLADAGLLDRKTVRTFDLTETYIKLAPLADAPEQVVEPERVATWGGKRVKACPHCHSTDLAHTVTCRACGSVMAPEELVEIEVAEKDPAADPPEPPDRAADGATRDTSPPPEMVVAQDAPLGMNSGLANGAGVFHHSARGEALELAQALSWPHVQIAQGATTGGDAETWSRFIAANPPERIDAALAALRALAPSPSPTPAAEALEIPHVNVALRPCPRCDSTRTEWWGDGDERELHCYCCGDLIETIPRLKAG
jgi:hypothetical protein